VKGTHFQSSFGHLIGYDAGYYGYQWALSDLARRAHALQERRAAQRATANAWRSEVLAKGGGEDETAMLTRFLGRAPNPDAYIAYLAGKN
jgi:thimet oligopeptidase